MNKNTVKSIQRHIQAGEKNFVIGDRAYAVTDLGTVLFGYTDAPHYSGSCAGVVLDGAFVPDRYFTAAEIAAAREKGEGEKPEQIAEFGTLDRI